MINECHQIWAAGRNEKKEKENQFGQRLVYGKSGRKKCSRIVDSEILLLCFFSMFILLDRVFGPV